MRLIDKLFILSFLIIVFSFYSCATERPIHGFPITSEEMETIDILGLVETKFEATIRNDEKLLLQRAYDNLLIIAKKQYTDDVDVKDIFLEVRSSNKNLWYLIEPSVTWHYTTVHAKGIVIRKRNLVN